MMIFFINPLSAAVSRFVTRSHPTARESTEAVAMNKPCSLIPLLLIACWIGPASAGDWVTERSYYTHDPMSGERVTQYTPIGPFYTYGQSSFTRSGYRNTRSSLQVGTSADNYHTTEQWGPPVQPYGEWRFPNRPYSVPYGQWGPQLYGGVPFGLFPQAFGGGYGGGGYGGGGYPGVGFPGGGNFPPGQGGMQQPLNSGPNPLQPGYSGQQQLLDGRYPPFQNLGPFEQKQLFDHLYPPRPNAGP
jgi:hypothetical protein